jgi:hypothetical protein
LDIVLKKPGIRKCDSCSSSDDVITAFTIESILSASNGLLPF